MADVCECENEYWCSINCEEFVEDQLASEEQLCFTEIFVYFRSLTNRLLANVTTFRNK